MLDRLNFEYPISLHIFSDGRDVAPKSISKYMKQLEREISKRPKLKIYISTLQGRVFLDRDRDWDNILRTKVYQSKQNDELRLI